MPNGDRLDHVRLRDDQWMVPGQAASQRRLSVNSDNLFPAFNSLEIMDVESAKEYLDIPLRSVGLNDKQKGRLFGVFLGFAMTCVEADRENRE